ncbi:helix-turn-helix transcriptional regulator [Pseudoxanthomonas dokdonensis]|uniref:helix-turn-helix transcriptional regulator n=1 Tax=Pseudoxanthomonas dokdonensis TaxID=344882 RepID=UPI001B806153|nr:helix-turn-helix transcriptional regulator [Pseudoxanthomonas dokdonensis]
MLQQLGSRLAAQRLALNLTQAELAEQAGVSKRTLERLEAGAVASQLSTLVRVCRVLGLADNFERLVPAAPSSPLAELKQQGGRRQRASGSSVPGSRKPGKPWRWDP